MLNCIGLLHSGDAQGIVRLALLFVIPITRALEAPDFIANDGSMYLCTTVFDLCPVFRFVDRFLGVIVRFLPFSEPIIVGWLLCWWWFSWRLRCDDVWFLISLSIVSKKFKMVV